MENIISKMIHYMSKSSKARDTMCPSDWSLLQKQQNYKFLETFTKVKLISYNCKGEVEKSMIMEAQNKVRVYVFARKKKQPCQQLVIWNNFLKKKSSLKRKRTIQVSTNYAKLSVKVLSKEYEILDKS